MLCNRLSSGTPPPPAWGSKLLPTLPVLSLRLCTLIHLRLLWGGEGGWRSVRDTHPSHPADPCDRPASCSLLCYKRHHLRFTAGSFHLTAPSVTSCTRLGGTIPSWAKGRSGQKVRPRTCFRGDVDLLFADMMEGSGPFGPQPCPGNSGLASIPLSQHVTLSKMAALPNLAPPP